MSAPAADEHRELHEVLADLVDADGSQGVDELAASARRRLRDPRITPDMVGAIAQRVTTLVLLPDGRVEHLGRVLDGIVLTQRVRGPLAGRTDLWLGHGAQPLLALACLAPLPLATGGEARISSSGAPALVGPPGWLPEADRDDLVGMRWRDGRLAVSRVEVSQLAGLREERHVRELVASHLDREQWLVGVDPGDLARRMVHALAQARLEDPGLLSTPHAPLEEILAAPAQRRSGMSGVYADLERLAQQQGTSSDQLAAAVLAQLALTSSAVDDREHGTHQPQDRSSRPRLRVLPGGSSRAPGRPDPSGPPEAG